MRKQQYSSAGAAFTELVLEIFRLNGRLLSAGDELVRSVGLSSARWQVVGAIRLAAAPQSVSWLSRSMGLSRQGVQRIVNELEADGFVVFKKNPAHRRAHLVALTRKGRNAVEAAERRQRPWANAVVEGIGAYDLERALKVLTTIRAKVNAERAVEK